jgi:hypothetical protein
MEKKLRALSFLTLVLFVIAPCASAVTAPTSEPLTLDLAAMTPDGVTTRPGGRNVTYNGIVLLNTIPRFHYNVDLAITDVGIPPLSVAAFGSERRGDDGSGGAGLPTCKPALKDLVAELDAAETELAVSNIAGAAIVAAPEGCRGDVESTFKALTQRTVAQNISLKSFQTLTVTVTRPGVTFKLVLPGTARGEWRTSYGFFFVPDRDERYFVNTNKKIQKDAGREEFDFVPTIVFTFFPNGGVERAGIGGLTAGLGYDLEKPFVFGGASWAYNENVIFTGGVAFHPQSRLLGKYHAGDEVSAELEPAQLVESTYGPNVYAGISFRFAENIHEKRAALLEARAEADEAAAAAKAKAKKAEEESKLRAAACTAQADADEAAAKVACKDDAVCIAKAEKDTAAKKAKCAVTELDRVKAEKVEREKQDALDKAEKRAKCEATEKAKFDKAVLDCAAPVEPCKAAAALALAEGKAACVK